MRRTIRRRHLAQLRAHGVCTEYRALFDATAGGRKLRATLDTHVADVERLFVLQARSVEDQRGATAHLRGLRRALRYAIKAVVTVGRLMTRDGAAMAALRMPGPMSDADLIAFANGLLGHIAPYADAFVEEGLAPDLLNKIARLVQAIEASKAEQSASRRRFTVAALSARRALNHGRNTIAALEALVLNLPVADTEALINLRIAKRVGPRTTEPAAEPIPHRPAAELVTAEANDEVKTAVNDHPVPAPVEVVEVGVLALLTRMFLGRQRLRPEDPSTWVYH